MKNTRNYIFTAVLSAVLSVETASASSKNVSLVPDDEGAAASSVSAALEPVSGKESIVVSELEGIRKEIMESPHISLLAKSIFGQMPLNPDGLRIVGGIIEESTPSRTSAAVGVDIEKAKTVVEDFFINLFKLSQEDAAAQESAKKRRRMMEAEMPGAEERQALTHSYAVAETGLYNDEEMESIAELINWDDEGGKQGSPDELIGRLEEYASNRAEWKDRTFPLIRKIIEYAVNNGKYSRTNSQLESFVDSETNEKGIVCKYCDSQDGFICTIGHELGHAIDIAIRMLLGKPPSKELSLENISMLFENLFYSSEIGQRYLSDKTYSFKKFRFAEIFFDFLMKGFASEFAKEFASRALPVKIVESLGTMTDCDELQKWESVKKYFGENGLLAHYGINSEVTELILKGILAQDFMWNGGDVLLTYSQGPNTKAQLNNYLAWLVERLKSGQQIGCDSHVSGYFYALRQIRKDGLLEKLNSGQQINMLASIKALQGELPESLEPADVKSTFEYLLPKQSD